MKNGSWNDYSVTDAKYGNGFIQMMEMEVQMIHLYSQWKVGIIEYLFLIKAQFYDAIFHTALQWSK